MIQRLSHHTHVENINIRPWAGFLEKAAHIVLLEQVFFFLFN